MTEVEKQNEEVQNKELTSILVDPEHFNVKHKLNTSWTIYYDIPQQRKNTAQTWQQNIKVIATFNTIEDFWGYIFYFYIISFFFFFLRKI